MDARRIYQVPDAVLVFRFEREGYVIRVPLDSHECHAPPDPRPEMVNRA